MLPIIAPLLSVGMGLVDKLVSKTDGEKDIIKGALSRLATEGNAEQLQAEVQKLSLLVESDKSQTQLNIAVVERGGLGWRDWLGYGCTISILYSVVGISVLNFIIAVANGASVTENPIAQLPSVDVAVLISLLGSMLGLTASQRISKESNYGV